MTLPTFTLFPFIFATIILRLLAAIADLEKSKNLKAGIAVKLMAHIKIAINFNKNLFFIFCFFHIQE